MSFHIHYTYLPESLRQTTHEMHTMYDAVKVPVPRDVTMLNATVLPMLMSEISVANTKITMMALTGTSSPGRT